MVIDVFVKFNKTLVFPDPAPPKLRLYKDGQEYQVNSDNNLFRLIIIIFVHHLKFVQNILVKILSEH